MGQCTMGQSVTYQLEVKTGDKLCSGADLKVYVKLHCNDGQSSEEHVLKLISRTHVETGETYSVKLKCRPILKSVDYIEIWRDGSDDLHKLYVEYIAVTKPPSTEKFLFPVHRWIKAGSRYKIVHLDTFLPHADPNKEQRDNELVHKKQMYELTIKIPNGPAQVKELPGDEVFSFHYKFDLGIHGGLDIADVLVIKFISGRWENLEDLTNVYTKFIMYKPLSANTWREDTSFGNQRIACMNNTTIELCSKVPDKLGVTNEMLAPFLEDCTMEQVIKEKRLFKVDHSVLAGIPCREGFSTCAPIALFFVNKKQELVPIAIQLFQEMGPDNPVFLPNDPPYVWMMAKMWFNNADANVHQSLTHLGFTHLLMEGIAVVAHRNLSQSHPLFKLLAPHFIYVMAINSVALTTLLSPNGWVNTTMNIGTVGMYELLKRGINKWRMDVEGTLPEDLKRRGVLDDSVLPGYFFRDDAMLLYNAINKYVRKYVDLYYDTVDKITGDWELHSWGKELVKDRALKDGGCGYLGVPGNGNFSSKDQLYVALTSIIYQCSVAHAATNFPQYDEYAFPPNYPALLRGTPPKDKFPRQEDDILNLLPDKPTTLEIMKMTKLLSQRDTKSLGHFEVQYIFEPEAIQVVDEFRADVLEISKTIKKENKVRKPPYKWLDPESVPNAISI